MPVASGAIRLAGEPDFALGAATVRPALSEVAFARDTVRLQPRVMQVLVALARAQGAVVSRDELVAKCWGGVSVGEDALNRCIQRLRKLSEELPGTFGLETIARVGYRLQPAVEAQPAPPETVASAPAVKPAPTGRSGVGRVGAALAILVVSAACVTVALVARWRDARAVAGRKVSIVVDQLQTAAGDAPARILQAGLSSDLARAMLANRLQVSVATAGSAGSHGSGRILLDGEAFTEGAMLSAQLSLRDAASQEILWSKEFSGRADQADALREQAALKVGAVLNCALHTRQGTEVTDAAVRLYLSACDDIGDSNADAALDRLRRLTILAPHFAQAWAELAATVATTANDLPPAQRPAAEREAVADARRALGLDSHTGLAYFALVQAAPGSQNWARRVALIEKGLEVEPAAAELDDAMGYELLEVGRSAEAVAAFRRAVDLDPLSPVKTADLIAALANAGLYEDAEELIGKARLIWPSDPRIWGRAFTTEAHLGDPVRAELLVDDADRPAMHDPADRAYWQAWLRYRRIPDAANRRQVLKLMQESAREVGRGRELARAYELAELGRVNAAYAAVLPAARTLTEDDDALLFRPELAGFRADPRFMTLAKRLRLVAIWRASGRWPDFCTQPPSPYDCAVVASRAPE